jgi:hypothetical protein
MRLLRKKGDGALVPGGAVAALMAGMFMVSGAQAGVTISSGETQNMSCSNGVCTPTAKNAILNAGDLENLLTSGNATVTTTGAGVQSNDIHVNSGLGWSSSNTLSLEAKRSIAVKGSVSVTGQGGLTLETGQNGSLSFVKKGDVNFANMSSQLSINGSVFTLAGDIKTLASDMAADPGGAFALAASYDAGADGTYTSPPLGNFTGVFEGLGNTISNFSLNYDAGYVGGNVGLFTNVEAGGVLENIGLVNANIICTQKRKKITAVGALVGDNEGTVRFSYATGSVHDGKPGSELGGLVGQNGGLISNSHAAVAVSAPIGGAGGLAAYSFGSISETYATGAVSGVTGGGLLGENGGSVTESYATGNVQAQSNGGGIGIGGGLTGFATGGTISNSYATGAVSGPDGSAIGGLVGANDDPINSSYSTGAVTGGAGASVGGLIGVDRSEHGAITDTYWDTETSGITDPSQGAGNIANDPGITGLTTAQFQAGLPAGFDPKVWSENSNINGGLPYLLSNEPPRN